MSALPDPLYGTAADAWARLATASGESRTMSTTATAGGNFVVNVGPRYVAEAFAEAARAAAVLTGILPVSPLPDTGLDVYTGRLTTGSSVGIASNPEQHAVESGWCRGESRLARRDDRRLRRHVDAVGRACRPELRRHRARPRARESARRRTRRATARRHRRKRPTARPDRRHRHRDNHLHRRIPNTGGSVPEDPQRGIRPRDRARQRADRHARSPPPGLLVRGLARHSTSGPANPIPWPGTLYTVPSSRSPAAQAPTRTTRLSSAPTNSLSPRPVTLEAFPEVGSATGTVRIRARQYAPRSLRDVPRPSTRSAAQDSRRTMRIPSETRSHNYQAEIAGSNHSHSRRETQATRSHSSTSDAAPRCADRSAR